MSENKTKILCDGDIILYRCGFAAERALYQVTTPLGEVHDFDYKKDVDIFIYESGGNPNAYEVVKHKVVEPLAYALNNVKTVLEHIMERFQSEDMTIYLTGQGNYRDSIAKIKPYKGNRDPDHKPTHYNEIYRYLVENYHTIIVEGAEADDALAFEQNLFDTVIVTTDKDLDQIPGEHFNWVKDERYFIEPEYAHYLLWRQVLSGDPTDNIQGIPGVGDKKADKILESLDLNELEDAVIEAYKDYYQYDGREYCIRYNMEPLDILKENKNLVEIGGELAKENIKYTFPSSVRSDDDSTAADTAN